MNFTSKSRTKCFWHRQTFCLAMALGVVLLSPFAKAGPAAENESIQYYKMLSTVEYAGKSQFSSQVETLFTVKKQSLWDDKVQYLISTNDFDLMDSDMNSGQQSTPKELLFVVDKKTGYLLGGDEDLAFWGKVNNQCIKSLKKVTKENVGKTWEQSFNLSSFGSSLPNDLKFTLTAIQLKTKVLGEMIAVRALSEPFIVKVAKEKGGVGPVESKISAVYLFDPEIENIYLSISVFEATTNINGFKEKLRHEMATYKTDAAGVSFDLSGLGRNFGKLVRKLGLTQKGLKVVKEKESSLPQWAQSEGLVASQVANICAATACEGALNPVVTVYIPAARTVALQSTGELATAGGIGAVSVGSALAKSVPGVGALKIAVAPAVFMGMSGTTSLIVGGGTATAIAVGTSGSSSSSKVRSPSTP